MVFLLCAFLCRAHPFLTMIFHLRKFASSALRPFTGIIAFLNSTSVTGAVAGGVGVGVTGVVADGGGGGAAIAWSRCKLKQMAPTCVSQRRLTACNGAVT